MAVELAVWLDCFETWSLVGVNQEWDPFPGLMSHLLMSHLIVISCMHAPFSCNDHTSSHDHTHKVSRGDFVESNTLLIAALDIRRKYMKIGSMPFCKTTAQVMDGNPPPSSIFCVPDTSGKIYLTKMGDVLPGRGSPQ